MSGGKGKERRQLTEEMVFMRTKCNRMDLIRNLNLWGNELCNIGILRLMPNLEVLSLSVNQVCSLAALRSCQKLSELYLRKNNIHDLAEVQHLTSCPQLRVLWLDDNPCATLPNYREYVLHHLPCLTKLDSQDVTEEERRRAAGIDVRDMQTCVGTPPGECVGDPDDEPSGDASIAAGMWDPPRYGRADSFGQSKVFEERSTPEQESAMRSQFQEPTGVPSRASRGSLRGQDGHPARQNGMGGGTYPPERAVLQRGHQPGSYPDSPDRTPSGSREPSEDRRLGPDRRMQPGGHLNGTNLGGRQRQDPRDAWADRHVDGSFPPSQEEPSRQDLEHQRGLGRKVDDQRAVRSGMGGARSGSDIRGGGAGSARAGSGHENSLRSMRSGDLRADPRNDTGCIGPHGGQFGREQRDDPRRQSGGLGGRSTQESHGVGGGSGSGGIGQDPGARADNILCAVLALIKELDGQGLELVRRAIEQRQSEL